MHVFEMVVIIVVVAILAGLIKEWINRKAVDAVDLTPIEERLEKLESLSERVKILEAIVTDKGYDLKSEIDKLR